MSKALSKDQQLKKMRSALAKAKLQGKGDYKPARRGFVAGRGDYRPARRVLRGKGDFWSVMKGVGNVARVALPVMKIGGMLMGAGDYNQGKIAPNEVPMFENKGRVNSFVYKEYLGDIYSSVDFSATTFHLNAGLGDPGSTVDLNRGVFPWLSRIAQQYEEYKITGCVFYYIPTSSDAVVSSATNGALGSVSIASEYNSAKDDFSSLTDMLNHQYSTSKKPSEMIAHPIECERKERPTEIQYVRSDSDGISGSELLHYDLCKTTVAVQGNVTDGEILGQFWVTYRVDLLKPILEEQAASPFVLSTHYRISVTGLNSTKFFGTTINTVPEVGSTFEVTMANTTITFPENITEGNFLLTYSLKGSSTASLVTPYIDFTSNVQALNILHAGTGAQYAMVSSTDDEIFYARYFTITGPGAVLTFGGGTTLPTSLTSGDLIITQINAAILTKPSEIKRSNFWRPTKQHPVAPWMKELRASREKHRNMDRNDMVSMFADLLELKRQGSDATAMQTTPLRTNETKKVSKLVQLYETKKETPDDDDTEDDIDYEEALQILKDRRAIKDAKNAIKTPALEEKKASSPASTSKKGSA